MDWLYKKLLTGALRKVLVAFATYLVTQGVLDSKDMPTILAKILEVSPAIAAFVWDWIEKHQDARHLQVAMDSSNLSGPKIAALAKDAVLR